MTPEQLKVSIIQSALQGKLVEQRREEGTAEELFEVIRAEKKRLIKEKRIKEEKELLEPDEYPYDIPSSWIWARITECGSFISGYTPKPAELRLEGTIPYFKVSDMNTEGNELYLTITNNYLKDDNSKKVYLKNTIVYPKNGGAVFTNKKRILAQDSVVDLNTGGYSVIGPVDLMYFYLYFSQIDFRQCYKGTALPTIDMDKLKKRWVPIPPLEEQHRIVAKIEELLPYVDRYAEAYEKLEQFNAKFPEDMKKSILQYAIQGKLVEQRPEEGTAEELYQQIVKDREEKINAGIYKKDKRSSLEGVEIDKPFDIPSSWKWVTLGSILLKLTDGTHKTPKYAEKGVKFVSVKDMSSGHLSLDNTKFISCEEHKELFSRCDPQRGDMLLSKVGTTGVPAIIDTDEEFSLFVSVALLKYNHSFIDTKFLFYLLQSPLVQEQAAENTRGVGNKNWVLDAIGKTLIVLPPYSEQLRIVESLEKLLPYCEQLIK